MQKQNQLVQRILYSGVIAVLVLIPFHALLTAWYASNFGFFDGIRLWKEALLAVLALVAVWAVCKDKKLRDKLVQDRLMRLTGLFVLWTLLLTIFGIASDRVSVWAAAYGLVIDIRIFVFLFVVLVTAHYRPELARRWSRYILWPALIVIGFGVLQLLLPHDFLRHFGYGDQTLVPFQTVDNKPELVRLQSTMRGPNPLGTYLVPVLLLLGLHIRTLRKKSYMHIIALAAGTVVLLGTYSRSAAVGMVVAGWILLYIRLQDKRKLWYATAVIATFALSFIMIFRDNNAIQNVVFHTNELSPSSVSSNEQRTEALQNGLKAVYENPLGGGVGSAGPASLRNTEQPGVIAENFFLQIAQETGIIGFGLFVAIIILVGLRLWQQRANSYQAVVFAVLIALVLINLISHAWADDTLAYIFAGMIGLALGDRYKNTARLHK